MKIYGNIDSIKKAIEKKYEKDLKESQKEVEGQIKVMESARDKEIELIKSQASLDMENAVNQVRSRVLNEEKLNAKRGFEEVREQLIQKVLAESLKMAEKEVHSQKYVKQVKEKMKAKKNLEIIGDSTFYSKSFPKVKVDKGIIGIKCREGEVIYDFTIGSLMRNKEEELRQTISKTLFG